MFRRREGRGTDRSNETRLITNLSKKVITLGDIDNLEIQPGRTLDLLTVASIQRIGSSVDLKIAVQLGIIKFKDRNKTSVSKKNISKALIPAVLRDTVTGGASSTGSENIRDIRTVVSDYTADADLDDVILVNATATITLPSAVGISGYHFVVKNIGTGTVTVTADGSEEIDDALTAVIDQQYASITVQSDNANWWIL